MLLPFQGDINTQSHYPRALPWSIFFWPFGPFEKPWLLKCSLICF